MAFQKGTLAPRGHLPPSYNRPDANDTLEPVVLLHRLRLPDDQFWPEDNGDDNGEDNKMNASMKSGKNKNPKKNFEVRLTKDGKICKKPGPKPGFRGSKNGEETEQLPQNAKFSEYVQETEGRTGGGDTETVNNQRNRSQEVPVSIPLPEDCLPKLVSVDLEIPQENCESLKSPATDEASSAKISSHVSLKVNKSSQPSRRSERINSQAVSPKTSTKSRKNTSAQGVPVSTPLPEYGLPKDATCDFLILPKVGSSSRTSIKNKKSSDAGELLSLPSDEPQKGDSVTHEDFPIATTTDVIIPVVGDSHRTSKKTKKSSRKAPKEESLYYDVPQKAGSGAQEDLPRDATTNSVIPKVEVSPRRSNRTKTSPLEAPELVSLPSDEPQKGDSVTQEPQNDSETKSSRRRRRRPYQEVSTSKSLCEVGSLKPETTASEMPQGNLRSTKLPSSNALTSKASPEDVPVVLKSPELITNYNKEENSLKIPEAAPVSKEDKSSTSKVALDTETSDAIGLQVIVKSVSQKPIEPKFLPEAVTPEMNEMLDRVSLLVPESKSAPRESKSKENKRKATSKSHREEKSPCESRSASKEKNKSKISPRRDSPCGSRCVSKGDEDKTKIIPRQDTSRTDSRRPKRERPSNKKEMKDRESSESKGEIHRKGAKKEKLDVGKSVEDKTDRSSYKGASKRCRSSEPFDDSSVAKKVAVDARSIPMSSPKVASEATPKTVRTPQIPDLPWERGTENAVGKLEAGSGVMQPGTLGIPETLHGKNSSTSAHHPLLVCNETERTPRNESCMVDSELKQEGQVDVHSNLKEYLLVDVDEQFPEKKPQAKPAPSMPSKNEPAQDVPLSDLNLVPSAGSSQSEVVKDQVLDSTLVDGKRDTSLTTHENEVAMHQSPLQIPIKVAGKLVSPELYKEKVAKAAPSSPPKGGALTQKSVTNDVFSSSSTGKKKSKRDIEIPKVMDLVEMDKDVESDSEALKNAEENPPSGVKLLESTVSDCIKNEMVVDTELAVSSPKKQMAYSPSKILSGRDEVASLREEFLGSSSKSPKTKAISPAKIVQDSTIRKSSQTAHINFSLYPSKVLDFGSPAKADDSTDNPPQPHSKSTSSDVTHVLATPSRASRWDSSLPMKSTTPSFCASPTRAPHSPGKKVKAEIQSGLDRICFKSSTGNHVVLETPKLPAHLEPDSSNNQSNDQLSVWQGGILPYSDMDTEKSTSVHEAKKEISDLANALEELPKSVQPQTTAAVISPSKKGRGNKESSLVTSASNGTKTSTVRLEAIPLPPEPAPPAPSSLWEADLLASLDDDTIGMLLDEPILAESIRSLATETIASSKPVNAPIFITVPSDSIRGSDSVTVNIVGTERQSLGNGLAQGFGSREDLLGMGHDSIPSIIPNCLNQEDSSIMAYSEAPATVTESTSATTVPTAAPDGISIIQLPSVTSFEQHPPVSKVMTVPRILSVATSGQVQTTSISSITAPPVYSIELPPETPVSEPPTAEEIEREIMRDHSENDQQNIQSPKLSLEEKFKQARLEQSDWMRPEMLDLIPNETPLPKMRYEAKRVNRLVMEIFSQHHPLYDYIMSQPMCQIGTTNFCPSWATKAPCSKLVDPPSASPPKTVPPDAEPTSSSSNSVSQASTSTTSASGQALNVDKTEHTVTVARRKEVGGEVISADSSAKSLQIVGSQSVPAHVSRQLSVSQKNPTAAQLKQNLTSLMNKAQSGKLDAETARKLAAMTQNPNFMAKINKLTPVVPIRPSTPTGVSQPKPVVVATASSPSQPEQNMLSAATGGTEPPMITVESKFKNLRIANNSPKFDVACNPATGVPAVKQPAVIGKNLVSITTQPVSAGSSRSPIFNTTQTSVVSPGIGRGTSPSTTQTFTVVGSGPGGSTSPSTTQTFTLLNPGRSTITSEAQQSAGNLGSSTVRVASALPRPMLVERVYTVPQPIESNVVPTRVTTQPQTVRVRKHTLPRGQLRLEQLPITKPETSTLPDSMAIPMGSEQLFVVDKKTPPAVAPGVDILAKALAGTGILPSDADSFIEESSPDLFSPASLVLAGSLGTDQI